MTEKVVASTVAQRERAHIYLVEERLMEERCRAKVLSGLLVVALSDRTEPVTKLTASKYYLLMVWLVATRRLLMVMSHVEELVPSAGVEGE